ncbi:MAG: sulfatase-like hydrolase/transferase [Paludibacter sp.]|nr:sulfatase-like hydrolase/transferase [Paludibacter sp.]
MKNSRLILLIKTFLFLILVFVLQKVLFMIYYHDIYSDFSFTEYLQVLMNGLKHDASIAGYLSVVPGLLIIASYWFQNKAIKIISASYFSIIAFIIAFIFVLDLILYRYWGFKLDSTPFFYLDSPANALASTSWLQNITGILAVVLITIALAFLLIKYLIIKEGGVDKLLMRFIGSFIVLFEVALLFLPIRGGLNESTMNIGKVYFSNDMVLNHAAVNPVFSLFESMTLQQNFEDQYRFLPENEAEDIFSGLRDNNKTDSVTDILSIDKPNVVFIILESFMSLNMQELGGMPGVAVNMDSLSKEGVLFTNFFANSFRTDRALTSIMSGYPAQPNTSLMRYPRKLQKMPSFPMAMKQEGYSLQYYYGGDADFASMRAYFKICGFDHIVEDVSFRPEQSTSKWGVPDHLVFNRLIEDITNKQQTPFLKVIQTLSSHVPYDVPFRKKLEDPYLNSVAYTDSCLGDFIRKFKQTTLWKNSIVIMVADHAMTYPYEIDYRDVNRYRIPLLIVGGALKSSMRVDTYASQIDIAATILHQLKIDHSSFTFSKNILNPSSPHFGYYTFKNGFGMVSPDNYYVYDYDAQNIFLNTGKINENKLKAEAFIQTLYDDMAGK